MTVTPVVAAMRRRLHDITTHIAQHTDRGEPPPADLANEAVELRAALSRAAAEAGQTAGWRTT